MTAAGALAAELVRQQRIVADLEATWSTVVRTLLSTLTECGVIVRGGKVAEDEDYWWAEGVQADEDARCALADAIRSAVAAVDVWRDCQDAGT